MSRSYTLTHPRRVAAVETERLLQLTAEQVASAQALAVSHLTGCTCWRCWLWWQAHGRDPGTGEYGPFGEDLPALAYATPDRRPSHG